MFHKTQIGAASFPIDAVQFYNCNTTEWKM